MQSFQLGVLSPIMDPLSICLLLVITPLSQSLRYILLSPIFCSPYSISHHIQLPYYVTRVYYFKEEKCGNRILVIEQMGIYKVSHEFVLFVGMNRENQSLRYDLEEDLWK